MGVVTGSAPLLRRWWCSGLPIQAGSMAVAWWLALWLLSSSSSWVATVVVAGEHHVVSHLPGFDGPLPFRMETGYVAVGEDYDVELFYYFVESERSPREDPLLLWLNGGPRCSAFSGLAFEIGPLMFDEASFNKSSLTLSLRPNSWTKVSNIIFLDAPDATGFSFSRNPEGYTAASDTAWSKQTYTFIKKWLADHPQFFSNPFYIGGESYAGKIIPIIAQEISEGIQSQQSPIRFKGYLTGNPIADPEIDFGSRIPFAHCMGIISDEQFKLTRKICKGQSYNYPRTIGCAKNLDTINAVFSELNNFNILENRCDYELSPKPNVMTRQRSLEESSQQLIVPPKPPASGCESKYYNAYFWLNNPATRLALHVKEGTIGEWERCRLKLPFTEDVPSSVEYHLNVTRKGYRALVYSGDHDLMAPYIGTQAWIRSLNFTIVDDWRSWLVGGQVAGYTRMYSNNLTFATVKRAGHTAPEYRPNECFAMFKRWISYEAL